MMNIPHLFVQLEDVPDEILMIIFKKMKRALALYSLMGINRRLNRILRDPTFVSHLTLMTCSSDGFIYPMYKKSIDRFCLHILPEIHWNIKWLNLEVSSMERLLLAVEYPRIEGFGLYNIIEYEHTVFFTDKSSLFEKFKKQISKLVIKVSNNIPNAYVENLKTSIFLCVFSKFPNLRCLNFEKFSNISGQFKRAILLDWSISPYISSSNLKELHVNVKSFNDCLFFLDDRFNVLEKFVVEIEHVYRSVKRIDNKKKLLKLKWFSLKIDTPTAHDENLVFPLLQRMSNLESLSLYFTIDYHEKSKFVDGNDLKRNILDHLLYLNELTFRIDSCILNQNYFPSNKEIENTFTNFNGIQVISYIDYFRNGVYGECHMYSYPYTMKSFSRITNHFPGGLFQSVRQITLFDNYSFATEFFIRISQSFPLLEFLSLKNEHAQEEVKQFERSSNKNLIIIYPRLIKLNLVEAHNDYVQLFLDHTKTYLKNKITLDIEYNDLQTVTHGFTRETTRLNCTKVTRLERYSGFKMTDKFKAYFPHLNLQSISRYY